MIAQGEGEEMIPEMPPGSLFAPTDDDLLNFYLARKIAGETVPPYIIATSNVFETEPWKLPIDGFRYGNRNEAYYFARRTQKGSRVNRQAAGGTWKATGSDKPVKNHHGVVVGYKLHLTYYYPHGSNEASNWILHEYRFASKDNSNPKPKFEEWVVCRIKHKTGKKETHHQVGGGGEEAHNLAVEVNQSAGLLFPPVSEMPAVTESTALALHHPNPSNDDDQVVQVEGREQQMMMDDGFQTGADMQLSDPDECIWDGDYYSCTLEELLQSPTPATADDHQASSLVLDKEDGPQAKKPRLNAPPIPDSTLHPSPITCLTPPPPMDMEGNDMGIRPFETTDHTAAAVVLLQSPHLSTANETWSIDMATVTNHTAADAGLLVQSPGWKGPFFGYQSTHLFAGILVPFYEIYRIEEGMPTGENTSIQAAEANSDRSRYHRYSLTRVESRASCSTSGPAARS